MNHRRIALLYLAWFEQEANELSVSKADGASSLDWNPTGCFVTNYTGVDGFVFWTGFVRALAESRLGEKDATLVYEHAADLVAATPKEKDRG